MTPLIYAYVNKLSLTKRFIYKRLIGKAIIEFIPVLESFSFGHSLFGEYITEKKRKWKRCLIL